MDKTMFNKKLKLKSKKLLILRAKIEKILNGVKNFDLLNRIEKAFQLPYFGDYPLLQYYDEQLSKVEPSELNY